MLASLQTIEGKGIQVSEVENVDVPCSNIFANPDEVDKNTADTSDFQNFDKARHSKEIMKRTEASCTDPKIERDTIDK